MKFTISRATLLAAALATPLFADPAPEAVEAEATVLAVTPDEPEIAEKPETDEKPAEEEKAAKAEAPDAGKTSEYSKEDSVEAAMKEEQERLALENSLADEKLKQETAELRAEIARLKVETELMTERLNHAAIKRRADDEAEAAKAEIETKRLAREAEIAKAKAEALANELKAAQAEAALEITELQSEIQQFEMAEKRKGYADSEPEYLANPLKDDGTLVISDRRIALNGAITSGTADYITSRIHYYNNHDRELPIFIVIDESPGGSVMAGYRILKSMEASEAPIHVVVKSFAASMAAAITTLAEESYAYPNAVLLHHQISATVFGRLNLTQQAEFLKESERWWERLAKPVADKMGITTEEFIEQMYESSTSGDWSEFGVEAQKLKWVNHIVSGIDETSLRRNPDDAKSDSADKQSAVQTGLDEDGRPVAYLPRLNPKDVYFLYNPDNYYRLR